MLQMGDIEQDLSDFLSIESTI